MRRLPIILREDSKLRIFALREDDVQKLLTVENVEKYRLNRTSMRNKVLIRVLLVTGVRLTEISNLRIEDIDLENGVAYVWHGKGRKQRTVLIDPDTITLLKTYCQGRDPESSLIGLKPRQIGYVVKQYAKAAGVRWAEHVSPHRLRDTFAVHWVRHQGDLESLRRLLGHNSLATTQRYLVFDFDEVKAQYDRIFGHKEKRLYE